VITIMAAVSQWEREAIGERTRDALRHKRMSGERVGNIRFGFRLSPTGSTSNQTPASRACSTKSVTYDRAATRCEGSQPP
jgi:DNA invertase Pin-like site-specific DNA recombinase